MSLQIPNLHVSSQTTADGEATVEIKSRAENIPGGRTGKFKVKITDLRFGADPYPTGRIEIGADLSDSRHAAFVSTSIEQVNSWGKHTPTLTVTGRCDVNMREHERAPEGCSFWLLVADNKRSTDRRGTSDVISFLVFDRDGARVAYGTGPVLEGGIGVSPT